MSDASEVMCDNCPFAPTGKGAHLRRSLRRGRFNQIAQAVWSGQTFYCHKTTDFEDQGDDDDFYRPTGKERVCGGSLAFVRRAHENRQSRARSV